MDKKLSSDDERRDGERGMYAVVLQGGEGESEAREQGETSGGCNLRRTLTKSLPILFAFSIGVVASISAPEVFNPRLFEKTMAEETASSPLGTTSADLVRRLRLDVANAAIDIMQSDTVEETAKSPLIDIGPFVDVVDSALDVLGVRGVYEEVFGTYQLVVAFNDAARARGVLNFFKVTVVPGLQGPRPQYMGIPNDRPSYKGFHTDLHPTDTCTGCIWWLRHWLGAITADKLVRDGSLRLKQSSKDERIHDAPSVLRELQRMARLPFPDILPFHAHHGFVWQYVVMTRPDLVVYPLDLAEAFCGNLLVDDEYIEAVSDDLGRECRHAFGHAVFYLLAMREMGGPSNFTVRKQLRYGGGFSLTEESVCEGLHICADAPNEKTEAECAGAMHHSSIVVGTPGVVSWEKEASKKRCEKARENNGTTR